MFRSLRELIDGPAPVCAPLALNPLMARMAEQAGFPAVYLGGGGLGYTNVFLEANLTVTELAQAGTDIAAVTSLPIILDGACGWGDPMHLHRTIATAEAAGFAAIELEDSVFPKRAGHHVGEDDLVPQELMEAKVREAVAARRDADFLIIARTNAAGQGDVEGALRRSEAYRAAGADVLLPAAGNVGDGPETLLRIGRELGGPLMFLAPPGGLDSVGLGLDELGAAGYRLIVDAMSLHLLVYQTLKAGYAQLAANGMSLPGHEQSEWWDLLRDMNATVGLDRLLEIERATVGGA